MAERQFDITRLPGFAAIAITAFVLLYAPIVTMVMYAFNASEPMAVWGGFSTRRFVVAWENTQVQEATIRSLNIATSASLIGTSVAAMAALGTTRRGKFKGRSM